MTEQDIRDEAERRWPRKVLTNGRKGREIEDDNLNKQEGFEAGAQWLLSQQGEGKAIETVDVFKARELAVDFFWENSYDKTEGYQKLIRLFDKWYDENKYYKQSPSNPPEVKEN